MSVYVVCVCVCVCVCLSVCDRLTDISYLHPVFNSLLFVHVTYGRGSALLCRRRYVFPRFYGYLHIS